MLGEAVHNSLSFHHHITIMLSEELNISMQNIYFLVFDFEIPNQLP